jgi:hypothetical protein
MDHEFALIKLITRIKKDHEFARIKLITRIKTLFKKAKPTKIAQSKIRENSPNSFNSWIKN